MLAIIVATRWWPPEIAQFRHVE